MSIDLVITGTGAVGPFGQSSDALWQSLLATTTSLDDVAPDDEEACAGPVVDFDVKTHIRSPRAGRAPLISQFAIASAAQAITQAGLAAKTVDKDMVSLVYGTGNGPSDVVERNLKLLFDVGVNGLEPLGFQESVFNAPASLISIEYAFRGPLLALPMGWAAGGYAVCAAADMLLTGQSNACVVVASDRAGGLGRLVNKRLKFISPNDGKDARMRPFDTRANGSLSSEGGGALILETRAHAEERGATILARLTGWSSTNDAKGVVPKRGVSSGILKAMQIADPEATGSDVVLAGSYCTADAELSEAHAIKSFTNGRATTATNIRGAVGDCKGVTGVWNVITAVKMLEHGQTPFPVGCEDINTDLAVTLPSADDPAPKSIMCNNFWISGLNTSAKVEAAT